MMHFLDTRSFKATAFLMVFVMTLVGFVPQVEAGFVSSTDAYTVMDRRQDLDVVQNKLENKMVTKRLEEFGYSKAEVQSRLAQLSDEEVHNLATQVGDIDVAGGALGFVIAVLIIAVLVIVILKLSDKTVTVS